MATCWFKPSLIYARPPVGFVPPYVLPDSGNIQAIGTNTNESIKPSGGITTSNWNGALFNSYGGGTFVEDFSRGGAYVIAGSGGHAHPRNVGAAVFDFEDATWKYITPTNAVVTPSDSPYLTSDTDGAPQYEITGSGQAPSPCHPYQTLCQLPISLGGGAKAGVIYVTRAGISDTTSPPTSTSAHKMTFASAASGTWARASSAQARDSVTESSSVYDAARACFWHIAFDQHIYKTVEYLRASDWTWQLTSAATNFPDSDLSGYGRCFMYSTFILKFGLSNKLFIYDPDNPNSPNTGWKSVTVSGTLPLSINLPAYYPARGKFYYMDDAGGTTLTTITPPADPVNGTWTVGTSSLSGSLPATCDDYDPTDAVTHYTRLFYVPAIARLAWIPGGPSSVYLANPT